MLNERFFSRISLRASAAFAACLFAATALSAGQYDEIDRYALNAPPGVESSIDSLVDYLVRPAHNEVEKLRAIFRWITANIVYDSEGFFRDFTAQFDTSPAEEKPQPAAETGAEAAGEALTPEMVLTKRIANCDGYSLLMEAMAHRIQQMQDLTQKATGLEIIKIKGFAKGFGYRVASGFDKSNHAWNAVKIDGQWRMIDCTWGAGHPDEKGQFVPEFEDYYFLTPPAELIYTHFPEEPAWQLTGKPVTKDEFIGLTFLWPAFFKYGMRLMDHPGAIIETGDELEITVQTPDSLLLDADLIEGNRLLEGQYTFVQSDQENSRIEALFPRPGEYVLRLYSRNAGSGEPFKETLNYKVKASAGKGEDTGFPLVYEEFLKNRACLYEPLQGTLKRGSIVLFRIKVPNAANTAVVVDDRWEQLASVDGVFSGQATLDGMAGAVYARFRGSLNYDCLLEYQLQ